MTTTTRTALAFAFLACLPALACGEDAFSSAQPLGRDGFPDAFASAWCRSAGRRLFDGDAEKQSCQVGVRALIAARIERVAGEPGAVFDAQAAGACVAALGVADTQTHFPIKAARACAAVVTGVPGAGAACSPAAGCATAGLICLAADNETAGVCGAVPDPHRAAAGDRCVGFEQPHEWNKGTSSDDVGDEPLGMCHSVDGLRCDTIFERCVPQATRGELCDWNGDCADGLSCDAANGALGTCHLPGEPAVPFAGDVPVSPAATRSVLASTVTAKTIAAGYRYTCAVTPARKVKCWGANDYGQLGAGLPINGVRSLPVDVVGLEDVRSISAAETFTCAVTGGGAVWCWGRDSGAIPLRGEAAMTAVPVRLEGIDDAVAVAAGFGQSCAIRAGGKVSCWGAIHSGEPDPDLALVTVAAPVEIAGLAGVVSIGHTLDEPRYVSLVSACAATAGGAVLCWGSGFLGNGLDGLGSTATPVAVRGIGDGVLAAGGVQNTWVLRASGAVVGWGRNPHGLLGDGTSAVRTTPVAVGGIAGAVDLAAAGDHTCVVLSNGHVACWGENENGQLGDGSYGGAGSLAPVEVGGVVTAVEVVAGSGHSCALLSDGQLVCWGDNFAGQLGRGSATSYPKPVVVRGL